MKFKIDLRYIGNCACDLFKENAKTLAAIAVCWLIGLAVGVAAGTMAYAAANLTTARQRRKMKRAAAKAIHSVEGFAGDLAGMMKS